jgi:hypothetical protein
MCSCMHTPVLCVVYHVQGMDLQHYTSSQRLQGTLAADKLPRAVPITHRVSKMP